MINAPRWEVTAVDRNKPVSVDEVGVEPAGDVQMGLIGWMWLMVRKAAVWSRWMRLLRCPESVASRRRLW